MPALPVELVWVPDRREQGTIGDELAPQSCEVETPSGTFRRNRRDIIHLPAEVISHTRPESHESDSETTSDKLSQSGGGLPSSPTHSLPRAIKRRIISIVTTFVPASTWNKGDVKCP